MRRPVILLLILLMPPLSARAEGQPDTAPTPEEVAADVLAAQDDEKVLGALAARDDPDPWLVADVLEAQGQHDAAMLFANAGSGPAIEPLAAYLEKSVRHRGIEAARAVLARALKAQTEGVKPALDALGKTSPHRAHVVGVRMAFLRGELLDALGRRAEAAVAFERAAEHAEVIGWRTRMADGLYQAGSMQYRNASYKEALALFHRRLAVETSLGSGIGQARSHFGIALVHGVLGRVDDEAQHRGEARALAQQHGDIEYLSKVITTDGEAAHRAGDSRRALELFEQAEKLVATLDPAALPARFRPDQTRLAWTRANRFSNCASMAMKLGEVPRARAYARKAVAAAGSVTDPTVLASARAFLALLEGVVHQNAGHYLEALSQFDRARGRYKRLNRRDEYASTLRRMAGVRDALGDRPAAVAEIEEALAILKETGNRNEMCRAHLEAGSICRSLGRNEEAVHHFEEALRLAILLRHAQLEIDALGYLARVHQNRVEYGQAVDLLYDALEIHKAHPKRTDPGAIYLGLGGIYRTLGDLKRAHEYVGEAIRLYEASGRGTSLTLARHEQTYLLREEGRHEEALAILEDLTRHYEETANRGRVAAAMAERADILLDYGKYKEWEEAGRLLTKVVGLHVTAGNRASELYARIQLARAQVWTDQKDKALDEATWALEMAEETGRLAHRVRALAGLAQVHVKREEDALAVRRAEEGAELISNYGLDLAEDERAAVRSLFASIHTWGLSAALRGGDTLSVYRFLERGRAAGLVASLGGRDALREAHVPVSLRRAEEKANAAAAMAYERSQQAREAGDVKLARTRKGKLTLARRAQQDAVKAIQRATRAQADLTYPKPAELAEVQKGLAVDDALVMYGWTGWQHMALVITRDAARATVLSADGVVPWDPLSAVIEGGASRAAVDALRTYLIQPLALKKSVRRMLISPTGPFARVPFSILEPERETCFVPSATTMRLLGTLRVASDDKAAVLALGDPAYDVQAEVSVGAAAVLRGHGITRLPATRKEVIAIGDVVLVGKEASETHFRKVLASRPHWRAIHLACHGLVDHDSPARSALVLASDKENDGFLHAGELFAQVPVPADLVVLSACETALGRIYAGEGLVGLARAFMLAGTPQVLASLWKVDDEATQALMVKFYELWNPKEGKGVGAAAALRSAQAHVRSHEKWKAPRYWAAWVLWGLPD